MDDMPICSIYFLLKNYTRSVVFEVREDNRCKMDREKMLVHANEVLTSGFKGTDLAKIMNMNVNQFYDYRNGNKKIEKARLETLIKFEKAYLYVLDKQKRTIDRKKGVLQ
ncbi:hypothetical protein [Enterococcus faecium]|nr:hypothetical protein [Enterococcus faecium]MCA6685804.1 hypothetical protein [Enterococcus faecium]MCA6694222.1 hypothetical protein [Enterococcus faecium]MCE3166268.1 hypothetical protein [Enterococcus faecium]MCU1930403.1 hypothetical protein [Enterococcus faecium]MCU1932997.1 hypothetical protein [Enterococcus faecium]